MEQQVEAARESMRAGMAPGDGEAGASEGARGAKDSKVGFGVEAIVAQQGKVLGEHLRLQVLHRHMGGLRWGERDAGLEEGGLRDLIEGHAREIEEILPRVLGRLGDSMVLSNEVGREQNAALLLAGLSHTFAAKTQGNMYAEALGGSGGAEATGGDGGGDLTEDEEMTLARIDLAFAAMHREALVEVAIAKTRTRAGHDEEAVAEVDPQGAVARKKAVAGAEGLAGRLDRSERAKHPDVFVGERRWGERQPLSNMAPGDVMEHVGLHSAISAARFRVETFERRVNAEAGQAAAREVTRSRAARPPDEPVYFLRVRVEGSDKLPVMEDSKTSRGDYYVQLSLTQEGQVSVGPLPPLL